jgi:hypothetical protein
VSNTVPGAGASSGVTAPWLTLTADRLQVIRDRAGSEAVTILLGELEAQCRRAQDIQHELGQVRFIAEAASDDLIAQSATLAAVRLQLAHTQGAMRADDERLNAAATKVWDENIHGCDAPDWMAEEILDLRAQLDDTRTALDGYAALAVEAIEAIRGGVVSAYNPETKEWEDNIATFQARLAQLRGTNG